MLQACHKAESHMRDSGLVVHKDIFDDLSEEKNRLLAQSKADYFKSQIEECKGDQKKLSTLTRSVSRDTQEKHLPDHNSAISLAEDFSSFFLDKILKIRDNLNVKNLQVTSEQRTQLEQYDPQFVGRTLSCFAPADEAEVLRLITVSPNKTCSADAIPTWLLKETKEELVPTITEIINVSLSTGEVPSSYKHALVTPLLKKASLDRNVLQNYRPVSNLPFPSKILEKVVAKRLEAHMNNNSLYDPLQSAYRKYHCTETAMIKVHHDITTALDNGSISALIMLDLSAAFDTIDHAILLKHLNYSFGITGTALMWFESYLTGRTQLKLKVKLQSQSASAAAFHRVQFLGQRATAYTAGQLVV